MNLSMLIWWYFLLNYMHIHWNIGCTRVKMGANGYWWMLMGALGYRGHGEHTKKASRVHLGPRRWVFASYGRGNFPGHDVLCVLPKMINNECRWMRIGSDGCNRMCVHERKQKQGKKNAKRAIRACFVMYAQGQKMQHFGRHGRGAQRM